MARPYPLPAEIQCDIFSYLTFHEKLRCSKVSKEWRSLILNWPRMWERLSTDDGHNIIPVLSTYKQYIHGPDVKHLGLKYKVDYQGASALEVIDLVCEQNCTRIEHVEFSLHRLDRSNLMKLMDVCGSSLTRIVLTVINPKEAHGITPDLILLHCPSLRKLYFEMPLFGRAPWASRSTGFQHQNLIDLALQIYDYEGTFDPSPFLESAPKLQRLSLVYSDISKKFTTLPSLLSQRCPELASLCICSTALGMRYAKETEWEEIHQAPGGLVEFIAHDFYGKYLKPDILRQIIEASHESLQSLEFKVFKLFNKVTLEFLSALVFSFVNRLDLSFDYCDYPDTLCSFLASSVPNLVSLTLRAPNYKPGGILLQTVASNMKQLEYVEFIRLGDGFTADDLAHFFDMMVGRSLRTIVLRFIPALTAQVMNIIVTKYPVIDEFVMQSCTNMPAGELTTALASWSLDRRMNKLDLSIDDTTAVKASFLSDQKATIQFLDSMDKLAKRWTLATRFPLMWPAFPYNCQYGTIEHVDYRARKSRDAA